MAGFWDWLANAPQYSNLPPDPNALPKPGQSIQPSVDPQSVAPVLGHSLAAGMFPDAMQPVPPQDWADYNKKLAALPPDYVGKIPSSPLDDISRTPVGAALQTAGMFADPGAGLGLKAAAAGVLPFLKRGVGAVAKDAGEAALRRMTQVPDIRQLPVDDALALARRQPHLIEGGDGSAGLYVGGPRNIQTRQDLTNTRRDYDRYVAQNPRGADWYDRTRGDINEVTGGNPVDNAWMVGQHKQWSAGVSPESELHFATKENNAALAGMPQRSYRGREHNAFMTAIDAQDPSHFIEGDKTSSYGRLITPDQAGPPGAVGTNDFRAARNWGYTEANDAPKSGAGIRSQQSTFMDYETALAVDRANQKALGGRTDWSGEKIQAAPWVHQKAEDIAAARGLDYETAFKEANKTIGDYYDKHTAFATHEAVPGADTGHLPGFVGAGNDVRATYSADPRSSWAFAPGGRDAVYAGMRLPDTGVAMRVRPTTEMQGMYTPPGGATELNPGWSARPLIGFDRAKGNIKSVPEADAAIMNAGEATRGYVDAQNASAWHKPWLDMKPTASNSLFVGMDRKATPEELAGLKAAGAPHGLSDIVDTGSGVTMTSFYPPPGDLSPALRRGQVLRDIRAAAPDASAAERAKVDSGYIDYTDAWKAGEGSGAATRQMLEQINRTPEIRAGLNNNSMIPQKALANLERDSEWTDRVGATRADIQNARRIIGQGPGWVDRLEAGLKSGALLPALAAGLFGGALARPSQR